MTTIDTWDLSEGQPPNIAPILGELVIWAGIMPSRQGFLFACGVHFVRVNTAPVPAGHKHAMALEIKIGTCEDMIGFIRTLEQEVITNDHTRALTGLRFAGLDGNILQFGSEKGVALDADGVRFVRVKPPLKRSIT